MRIVATTITLALLLGCGGLVIEKDDNVATKGAKVATRAVLGVGTLGISELGVAKAKREKEFQDYLESLPPEEREFEKLLLSLVSDETRRDYIRSLPPDQRTKAITQLIVEKERQEADQPATTVVIPQYEGPKTWCTPGVLGCDRYPGK